MIQVKNLTFTYPGGSDPAVRDLAFEIEPAKVFGFLGPSGAGKSTTQKIITGLLQGFQGQVSIMDRNLAEWGSDLYEQIGVTFELPNHYLKLTALENLNYFRSLYSGETEDPRALLEMVGLEEEADKRVAHYSKGMQMRLNFVRGLLNKPRLLFLDEPTIGLDPVNAANIKDIIRQKQAEGVTIFLTTHNMSVADELCDQVGFIVDGELALVDPPKALKLRYGQRTVRVEVRDNGQLRPYEFPLDGLADNADFLTALRDNEIETIHTQETTLEDVFIQVTGRELK